MIRKTVLDNGLRVVTERIHEVRSVTLGLWVCTGSRYEREDQAGLSHYLEHLFFKGTETRSASDIAEAVDAVGGQLNAFTEKEVTCFYARIMDCHLPLAVELLCDMLLHSRFDPEEMERERGVILEEIKMYEDAPDEMVFEHFTRAVWGGHPLGRPILGRREAIAGLTRERLLEYLDEHYCPANMVVAAAGNLEHEELVRRLQEQFRGIPPGTGEPPVLSCPLAHPGTAVHYRECEQVYLCYGGQGLCHTDERRYALQVLDNILGGSVSSRLFQEIREKRGLVYTVSSFQSAYRDGGLFGIYAGTGRETLGQVLELIRAVLADLRGHGPSEAERERAQECLKGALALALESTSNRMMRLARSEIFHRRLIPVEEMIERIGAVTREDVMELAEELLDPERFTLTVLGPVEAVEGVAAVPALEGGAAAGHAARGF